jgi:hypothetical protein
MKLIFLLLFSFIIASNKIKAQQVKTPSEVVQENLFFYNQRNIEGFMSSFPDTIAMFVFGKTEPVANGTDAIRKLYKNLFEDSPKLYSTVLHRSVVGNKVIDHESIIGRKGKMEPIEIVMVYEVFEQKIIKMTVIRE